MKRLFILRHAQAAPAEGVADFDRPLSPDGEKDAFEQGKIMKAKNYMPNMVVCSPALRTKMTLDGVLKSIPGPVVEYPKKLYDGNMQDYQTILETLGNYSNVMLVGHNPVIHALAANLAKEDGSTKLSRLVSGYIPGTLSVFECNITNWEELGLHANRILDYLPPPVTY